MKKIIVMAIWMIVSMPVIAQKTDTKYTTALGSYLKSEESFLTSNNLSSQKMRKMMEDTFRDKQGDADFNKALDKYFTSKYEKDLVETLSPYFSKELSVQQMDSLVNCPSAENIKRVKDGMTQCADAEYRDKKVDETLSSNVQKSGKKKKKKNMKKFKSDCPEDYRNALSAYNQAVGNDKMAEDMVNAIYHTVSIDDLNAYTAYLGSGAIASSAKAEKSVADDIYNVQAECISKFQTWTYKTYPSLFTKKQVQPKKRKGRKGKSSKTTKQNNDEIIDGGVYH